MSAKCLFAAIGSALCLVGCFSVESAKLKPSNAEHVVMNNYGWKLFDWIPLVCGNAAEDATMGCALFRDDVTFEKIQTRFAKYANGREIACPAWTPLDYNVITVFGIPIPYVVTYKEYTLSGTLK